MKEIIYILAIGILCIRLGSSAHFIVGYVEDGLAGEPANGKEIIVWNYTNSSNNITDIIGPTGNSGVNNIYMIDCELFEIPCQVGDILSITVQNSEPYFSNTVNVTVTGAGFDQAQNLTINTPVQIETITVDDSLTLPANEIDLSAAGATNVSCTGIITDVDNETEIQNVSAIFFDNNEAITDPNDNNTHYTNSSCNINYSYADTTQAFATCNFSIQYYANATSWNCTMTVQDTFNNTNQSSDLTTINKLIAIGIDSPINFGQGIVGQVSNETQVNITNYGNTQINISLEGYGNTPGDGAAMICGSNNITVEHEKYNLTSSNPGNLNFTQFDALYQNLTTNPIVRSFNLGQRTNDALNDANKSSYWRIYMPSAVSNNCTGNIIFGAVEAAE